jgi:hypothetical protein
MLRNYLSAILAVLLAITSVSGLDASRRIKLDGGQSAVHDSHGCPTHPSACGLMRGVGLSRAVTGRSQVLGIHRFSAEREKSVSQFLNVAHPWAPNAQPSLNTLRVKLQV